MHQHFPGGSVIKNLPAMQERWETRVWSLSRKILWGRKWQPLQYSSLGNSIDGESCQAIVHGVTKQCDMAYQLKQQENHINTLLSQPVLILDWADSWSIREGLEGECKQWHKMSLKWDSINVWVNLNQHRTALCSWDWNQKWSVIMMSGWKTHLW